MRARDLAVPFPIVRVTAPAVEAVQLLTTKHLPGIVVVNDAGLLVAVLSSTQVLRMALPAYAVEDPTLARVVDENAADVFIRELDGRSVKDCLAADHEKPSVVDPGATVLEIASLMAATGRPLVAVADKHRRILGVVTLDALMNRVVGG